VRIEPGETEAGRRGRATPLAHPAGSQSEAGRTPGAAGRQDRVRKQEAGARQPDRGQQPAGMSKDRAGPKDAGGDEHHVRKRTNSHDQPDVAAQEPLPQDEGVLRPDRDDQREAESQTSDCGRKDGGRADHALKLSLCRSQIPVAFHSVFSTIISCA
jgi:hypothetical protein